VRLLEQILVWSDHMRQRARYKQWPHGKAVGREGEDVAHRYLQRQGYYIVARNFRTPGGSAEVDLVAREGDVLVFVEVKARESDHFGAPERNIDSAKRHKIVLAARQYLRRSRHDPHQTRFDTISIVFSKDRAEIDHRKGVFGLLDAV
jgi:putative endonuclease